MSIDFYIFVVVLEKVFRLEFGGEDYLISAIIAMITGGRQIILIACGYPKNPIMSPMMNS